MCRNGEEDESHRGRVKSRPRYADQTRLCPSWNLTTQPPLIRRAEVLVLPLARGDCIQTAKTRPEAPDGGSRRA